MLSNLDTVQQEFYNKWNQTNNWTYIEAGTPATNCINITTSYFFIHQTKKITRNSSFYIPFRYQQYKIILKNSFNE